MGNISSRQDDVSGNMLYLKDQSRFCIKSLTISNGRQRVVLTLTPNAFPATRLNARREPGDDVPIAYIQDPEASSPTFLLRLDLEDELDFQFTFISRQQPPAPAQSQTQPPTGTPATVAANVDTNISGLTFAYASNARDLDTLITREFHSDPNLHKNSNVQLIGDMATGGSPSVELSWSWRWRPPKTQEDRGGGWRNNCSFLEYDSRAHRLNTLASFAFWVHKPFAPAPVVPMSPQIELAVPPVRHRMPSAQSYQSAVSDSEGHAELVVPASPLVPTADFASLASTATSSLPSVDVGRPGEDMSNVEDGPVFRANMKSLEQKTGSMRAHIKKVLKKAEAAQLAQVESNEAIRAFLAALQEASSSNAGAFKPALDHYFANTAKRILQYEEENGTLLRRQIIDPLSKLYTNDIKQAESKKKDFEEESREYYAYVGRYLGQKQDSLKEKKRAESDTKYQNKKRNFELKRFDYSNFMQDLHGGRKEQELLAQLTKFADGQAKAFLSAARKIEQLQPQLDALVHEVAEADKEYKIQRTGREEKRRNLEMNNNSTTAPDTDILGTSQPSSISTIIGTQNGAGGYSSDTDLSRADSTGSQFSAAARANLSPSNSLSTPHHNGTTLSTSPGASTMTGSAQKFRGIRDLEERDLSVSGSEKQSNGQARKEGLLWALSKPGSHIDPKGINKQAWHKFWIVLDQGKLSEYSNWKDKMELHRDPIDLRMASVRMARDAERRFCFEVITPHYKRIYQATTEDEMNVWINSINNALQGAFEAPRSDSTASSARDRSEFGAVLTGKSLSQSGPHGSSARSEAIGVTRRVTVGSRPSQLQSAIKLDENATRLLDQLRANDAGNSFCADCGSNSKVEWVSLNLGIILCIECGGVHRSLGTHVSKVRSLTLDVHSFTDDIVELLMLIGNRVSNMVWEATLERRDKPEPWTNREQRLKFITSKYVDRSFVEPLSAPAHFGNPDENLLASIKKNDIQGVLLGIAQRANVNVHDKSRNTHAVFLALAAADPARSASVSPSASPTRNKTSMEPTNIAFPVAELLLQNGAEVPPELPAIPLSDAAQRYIHQRNSRPGPVTDTLMPLPIVVGSKSAEQAKLQKRGSAGARFAGKVVGLTER